MAKMRNAKPKRVGSGYERFAGDRALAVLLAKIQSTIISNGAELERIIVEKTPNVVDDLDDFVNRCNSGVVAYGTYLCPKSVVKKSEYRLKKHEPDFLVFEITPTVKQCYVVELKDGDTFDTKKSEAEKEMLVLYVKEKGPELPFKVDYYLCSFNQSDKQEIVDGFKHSFSIDKIMTGEEFCRLLGIDFEEIVAVRKEDSKDNFEFFLDSLWAIPAVRKYLIKKHPDELAD